MSWATKPCRFGGKHLDYFHTEITQKLLVFLPLILCLSSFVTRRSRSFSSFTCYFESFSQQNSAIYKRNRTFFCILTIVRFRPVKGAEKERQSLKSKPLFLFWQVKNTCSGNSFSPVRNEQKRSSQFGQAQKKKKKRSCSYNNNNNKNRIKGNIFQLYVLIMWLICFKGQRNQTQRGMVSFQIQLTSLFIYTYILRFLFLEKTSEMCVCSWKPTLVPLFGKCPLSQIFFLDVSAIPFGMPWSELDKDSTTDNSKHLYCFQYIKMESLWDKTG